MIKETNMEQLINEYIAELSAMELKVFKIAQRSLESSFSIEKSIGFLEWLEKTKTPTAKK